jgi:hypothetical protein
MPGALGTFRGALASARGFFQRIGVAISRAWRLLKARPWDAGIYAIAVVFSIATVAWPLMVSRYPAMTDLPFHAAMSSAFRHYFDDSYHFKDQFELQPFAVPYMSSYLLAAFFMLFLPAVPAVKLATAVMLLMLPVGLGVFAWGMRKTPLLGTAGLPFIWCDLTHWGFINFVSALGLFAMTMGLALRALDRPSRKTEVALGLTLVVLFFTHIFRFPFALAGVAGTVVVAYPVTRRWRPAILPAIPSAILFAIFWFRRAVPIGGSMGPMTIETNRLRDMPTFIVHGFNDPAEMENAIRYFRVVVCVAIVSVAFAIGRALLKKEESEPESEPESESETEAESEPRAIRDLFNRHFTALVTLVPLACSAVALLMYLTLPMEIGVWWYVYPREATATCFFALACLPDLPKLKLARAGCVVALGLASLGVTRVVANGYAEFGRATEDFHEITELIPRAPKLLYLIYDHSGSSRTNTPFIHLPAYVQAEKGGWLSFHFAVWGTSPVKFRTDPDAVVPPPVPIRWEWTPQKFDLARQGPFFDWFLVRTPDAPDVLFMGDPTIVRVAHKGRWWLYHREAPRVPEPTP